MRRWRDAWLAQAQGGGGGRERRGEGGGPPQQWREVRRRKVDKVRARWPPGSTRRLVLSPSFGRFHYEFVQAPTPPHTSSSSSQYCAAFLVVLRTPPVRALGLWRRRRRRAFCVRASCSPAQPRLVSPASRIDGGEPARKGRSRSQCHDAFPPSAHRPRRARVHSTPLCPYQ